MLVGYLVTPIFCRRVHDLIQKGRVVPPGEVLDQKQEEEEENPKNVKWGYNGIVELQLVDGTGIRRSAASSTASRFVVWQGVSEAVVKFHNFCH